MWDYTVYYREHLTDADLAVIAAAGLGPDAATLRTAIRDNPRLAEEWLRAPEVFAALFESTALEQAGSPFLTFGVLVHRIAEEIDAATYVLEFAGPERRLPVFDVASLQDFVSEGIRRYFLIELLTSFTRVASGSTWVRTRKGYRRRRFSELDPIHLIERVEMLPPSHRPAGYRRLGDVALFLSGVFPDHTASHPIPERHRERVARSAGLDTVDALRTDVDLTFYEAAGAGWYGRAYATAEALSGSGPRHLLDLAGRFDEARRVLNFLTDKYLYRIDPGIARPRG